jgi:transposase
MSYTRDPDGLSDDQWARLAPFMPGGCRGKRGPRSNNRLFMDAVLWMARSGGRWRDLPERFGKVQTVKQRYYDWIGRGVFTQIFEALAAEPDMEWLMLDATIVRAHQHAAGARRQKGGRMPRALAARAAA